MGAQRKDVDFAAMCRARAGGATYRALAAMFRVSPATAWNRTRGVVLEGGDVVAGHGRSDVAAQNVAGPAQDPTSAIV